MQVLRITNAAHAVVGGTPYAPPIDWSAPTFAQGGSEVTVSVSGNDVTFDYGGNITPATRPSDMSNRWFWLLGKASTKPLAAIDMWMKNAIESATQITEPILLGLGIVAVPSGQTPDLSTNNFKAYFAKINGPNYNHIAVSNNNVWPAWGSNQLLDSTAPENYLWNIKQIFNIMHRGDGKLYLRNMLGYGSRANTTGLYNIWADISISNDTVIGETDDIYLFISAGRLGGGGIARSLTATIKSIGKELL